LGYSFAIFGKGLHLGWDAGLMIVELVLHGPSEIPDNTKEKGGQDKKGSENPIFQTINLSVLKNSSGRFSDYN
jgi:hypothetical protein